jgi:hypothetical protein
MKRNLKALGLALVAALALSAAAVTVAPAEEGNEADFWAAEGAVKIDVTSEGTQLFESAIGNWQCHDEGPDGESAGHGTAKYTEETKSLTSEHVEYTNCTAPGPFGTNFPVTVDMNGCDFLFTAGTYTKEITTGSDGSDGSVHIECPDGKEITRTIFKASSVPPHSGDDLRCTIHIPEQSPKGTATFHNATGTNGKMAVTATVDELEVTETITDANTIVCNHHTHEVAKYTGSFWAEATNEFEEYVDHTVTETVL